MPYGYLPSGLSVPELKVYNSARPVMYCPGTALDLSRRSIQHP